jgi:hypothetical protein
MNDEEAMPEQGPRQWLAVGQVLVLTLLSGDHSFHKLGCSHLARTQSLPSAWADKILLFSLLLKIVGIEPIILYCSLNLERRLTQTHTKEIQYALVTKSFSIYMNVHNIHTRSKILYRMYASASKISTKTALFYFWLL